MMTLGKFLIDQLHDFGADHIFGLPGDYTLNFLREVENDPNTTYVGVSREDSAGYAADAYARMRGCGACCVTYSVGGMNVMNPVAGAFAERSPVVVIAGIPNVEDVEANPYKHHTIDTEETQKNIFDNVVCNSVSLDSDDIVENMGRINYALQSMRYYSRPVYIEFSNKDIIREVTQLDLDVYVGLKDDLYSTTEYNDRWTTDVVRGHVMNRMFREASNRVLILGHEIFRTSLEYLVIDFARKLNIPVFTTILGKSTINESDPIAMGAVSQLTSGPAVPKAISESDCIVTMGMNNTDVDGFTFTPHFSVSMSEGVEIMGEQEGMPDFRDMVTEFCDWFGDVEPQSESVMNKWRDLTYKNYKYKSGSFPNTLTLEYVFDTIGQNIEDEHIVISDIGESLFGMIDVPVSHGQFLCMAYYTSMSFSTPAAIGVKFAKPAARPIIIVGDGAFQMTGSEFSSHIRYGLNTIVIILNNKGYSTERAIMDGKFNDIHNWHYEKIVDLMDGGVGKLIDTPVGFGHFLNEAIEDKDQSYVMNVQISPSDMSPVMRSIAQKMCRDQL